VPQGEKLEKPDPDLSYRPIFCALALFMDGDTFDGRAASASGAM
jgi:hypothetical protein